MPQSVVNVAIEVQPRCATLLCELIAELNRDKQVRADLQALKHLHFMSMTVFTDQRYDPTWVIEVNADGPAGPFWVELEDVIGTRLRKMLRFCKRPNGAVGDRFDAVTEAGSALPIAPLLEALTLRPKALHQGNRGTDRAQVEEEARLFLDVRKAMTNPMRFHGRTAEDVHQALRAELIASHPCLSVRPPRAIGWLETAKDWGNALAFAVMLLLVLHVPGVLVTWIAPPLAALAIIAVPTVVLVRLLWNKLPTARDAQGLQWSKVAIALALVLIPTELLLTGFVLSARMVFTWLDTRTDPPNLDKNAIDYLRSILPKQLFETAKIALGGLLGVVPTVLAVLLRLRKVEVQDPALRAAEMDARTEREIAALEDRGVQNHLSSLVHLKPGLLRAIAVWAALRGLGLAIRANPASARDGYLVNVRTIHFAHLTLVGNGSRLMFLANFDGTWDNYVTDFIEKVHLFLTLVWTSGVGFPQTRFLVLDGATHGRLFKLWKRRAMAPTLFWFSAYPALSVEQIRRQARIAVGLREAHLKPAEARKWALDL